MKGKRTKGTGSSTGAKPASKAGKKPEVESATRPSKATRDLVAIAAGGGTPEADIACALGIELSTLRKVYRYELSTGAFRKRVELVQTMYGQAKKGNTGAAKAYLAMQPATVAPPAKPIKPAKGKAHETPTEATPDATPASAESDEAPARDPRPLKLGKKEQQKIAARTAQAGSGWSDILPDHNTRAQ